MSSSVSSLKQIIISDRATLMNVLLKTDCYTIGTGIMPSDLNDGKIVSIPIKTDETYTVGYIIKENRVTSKMTNLFISLLNNYGNKFLKKTT